MAEAEKDAADSRDERQEETQAEKDKIVDESKSGVEEKKRKKRKKSRKPWHCLILRSIYLRRNWLILIM